MYNALLTPGYLYVAADFNVIKQQLVLATDVVAVMQLVTPPGIRQDIVQSHRNSISGVVYSMCFNHLITACRSGVRESPCNN